MLNNGNNTPACFGDDDSACDWPDVSLVGPRASLIRWKVRKDSGLSTGNIELVFLGFANDTTLLVAMERSKKGMNVTYTRVLACNKILF